MFLTLLCTASLWLLLVDGGSVRQLQLPQDPSIVQTTSGVVKGHPAPWPSQNSVLEFLGIPYAQAPLGPFRFQAPQRLPVFASAVPFEASSFSQDCLQYKGAGGSNTQTPSASPQLLAYGFGMGGGTPDAPHSYGEDCLTVNVWTKTAAPGAGGKAVMIWIYGGAFSTGTSNAPFYSGARLAQDEDVVVVSFNYRINIFGFPNAPGLADQNVALLDQRMAIEWVRDNVAAFGGDPNRITLFGESAGAASLDLYAYAWTQDPIVNGFIAQSGSASLGSRSAVNNTPWYMVSAKMGCGGEEAGESTLACMRTKDAQEIMNTVGTFSDGSVSSGFGPAADEKLVFTDMQNRSASGNFVKKPLLIGNNDFELGLIRALPGSLNFGGLNPNAPEDVLRIGSELAFGCGAAKAASDRIAHGVPAWRYRYMAVWDNTALSNTTGAYHSSEIPIALGTNPLRPNSTADTKEEAALTKAMVHAWAEFAKDPSGGLTKLGWPQYNPNGTTLIRLGYQNLSTLNFGPSTQYDSACNSKPSI